MTAMVDGSLLILAVAAALFLVLVWRAVRGPKPTAAELRHSAMQLLILGAVLAGLGVVCIKVSGWVGFLGPVLFYPGLLVLLGSAVQFWRSRKASEPPLP